MQDYLAAKYWIEKNVTLSYKKSQKDHEDHVIRINDVELAPMAPRKNDLRWLNGQEIWYWATYAQEYP